ncbi:MAG: RagB/SusD family nutrient uptake outer membrane protein [Flavicella sp.]|nr:RagB/SusD family nutrient uptake outer membrane protein [Flavicella sp.]
MKKQKNTYGTLKFGRIFMFKMTLVFLGLISLESCTDDLEQINPNALTTISFWQDNNDLNTGLTATYSTLKDRDILGILFEPTRADVAVPTNFRVKLTNTPMSSQTFDQTTKEVQDKWNALYQGVFRANQVIDAYNDLLPTYETANARVTGELIYAQARALRGYFYLELYSSFNFGSVPVYETVPKTFDDFHKAFSKKEYVKEFLVADLMYGLDKLPATYSAWGDLGDSNIGRMTGGACEALLARAYMYDNEFSKAEPLLMNVMSNYGYELAENLNQVFTGVNEFNNESIFEVNYSMDQNILATDEEAVTQNISSQLGNGNGNIQPTTWMGLLYRNDPVDPADPANQVPNYVYDNGELVDPEPADTRLRMYSSRMGNSVCQVDDPDEPMYGVTAANYGQNVNATPMNKNCPVRWKKFTNWFTVGDGYGEEKNQNEPTFNKSGINIPVIRLAEIYLYYAECMLENGDVYEGLKYINRVRKRSHVALIGNGTDPGAEFNNAETTYVDNINLGGDSPTNEVNLENVKKHLMFVERPLELALESNRPVNLRRWGELGNRLTEIAKYEYDAYHYAADLNGDHPKRFRCYVVQTGDVPYFPASGFRAQEAHLRDAFVGSTNYNADFHSYLPIPQDEINGNLNWNVVE